jgi:hypothetical protein
VCVRVWTKIGSFVNTFHAVVLVAAQLRCVFFPLVHLLGERPRHLTTCYSFSRDAGLPFIEKGTEGGGVLKKKEFTRPCTSIKKKKKRETKHPSFKKPINEHTSKDRN